MVVKLLLSGQLTGYGGGSAEAFQFQKEGIFKFASIFVSILMMHKIIELINFFIPNLILKLWRKEFG